jgi:membrane-bound lytic murein transglycosylase B
MSDRLGRSLTWVQVLGATALVVGAAVGLVGLGRVATTRDQSWRVVVADASVVPAAPGVSGAPGVKASSGSSGSSGSSKGGPAPAGRSSAASVVAAASTPDPAWVRGAAQATGIPARAMTAYGRATLELATQRPACRLGWTTIAGIGAIESGHGTHGGTSLGPDGIPSKPILGPALDGRNGFAAVPATPRTTALHGDPRWDHAMGPMQFIPSTWQRWASDGNGDGVADPQEIDDAAYATGRYLCVSGVNVSSGAGWQRAVLSYNHSDQYARDVLDRANRYARASLGG